MDCKFMDVIVSFTAEMKSPENQQQLANMLRCLTPYITDDIVKASDQQCQIKLALCQLFSSRKYIILYRIVSQ